MRMLKGNYLLVLEWYLDALKEMAEKGPKHAREGASRVLASSEVTFYRVAVDTYQNRMDGLV
jgi:hypothetical protein